MVINGANLKFNFDTDNQGCRKLLIRVGLLKKQISMKKLSLIICLLAFSAVVFSGCKKKDGTGSGTDLNKPYKVKFVGTVSAGSKISSAVVVWGVNNTAFSSLSGTSWTKEYDLIEKDLRAFTDNPTKNIGFGIQADGKDANATAKVEIFVNGTSVKVANGSGATLSPDATYIFD